MIKEIQELFYPGILEEAVRRYGVTPDAVKDLGGFESYVYEFVREGKEYILKITHSLRRTADYIHGELDWLNYLGDRGVSVARAVPSLAGNILETIPVGDSYFIAYAFEKAQGHLPHGERWNEQVFETWGATMGQMHTLTKEYQLPDCAWKRQEWYQEDQLNLEKYLRPDDPALEKARTFLAQFHSLPVDRDLYGLCHTDFHARNFFVDDQGKITVFDFDDCGYNWFANDIAIALFYALWAGFENEEAKRAFACRFIEAFLRGYRREHEVSREWIQRIPDFLRMRHILIYVIFHQVWDMNNLEERQKNELERYQRIIVEELPVVDIDYTQF